MYEFVAVFNYANHAYEDARGCELVLNQYHVLQTSSTLPPKGVKVRYSIPQNESATGELEIVGHSSDAIFMGVACGIAEVWLGVVG